MRGIVLFTLALLGVLHAALGGEPALALLRADGTMEFRPAGAEPQGLWKLYIHGPAWEQAQTAASTERRDEGGDDWRTLGGKLAIPAAKDRHLVYVTRYTRREDGFDVDVDLRFRREASLQQCSLALFWETATAGGEVAWMVPAEGAARAVTLPRDYGPMILWQEPVRELKLAGPMPMTIRVDSPTELIVQDNREYAIDSVEFRFNFVQGGAVRAGEHVARRFSFRFAEPTRVVLDEAAAVSRTDTAGWIPWAMPWDAAPVDLSWLNETPAGSHGFLGVKDDRFVFADGTEARFWGTNLSGEANFPDKEQAPAIAARLAANGINLVRVHHADAPWASRGFIDYTQPDSRHFSAENRDRYDYFAAELKKRGVYIYLDQLVHRQFRAADGVEAAAELPPAAKPYALFDERLLTLQEEYSRALWTHVNPYTGLAPKDDPQYVLMEYANEHDFFTQTVTVEPYRSQLEERFRAWARSKEIHIGGGKIDFTRPTDPMIRFFVEMQTAYHRRMRTFLREEVGVRIPMTGSNWARTTSLLYALRQEDYTEAHGYSDHPWGDELRVRNAHTTAERRNIFSHFSFNRLAGKPFMAAEWDQSWPNEWRAELPLAAAAVGALQGWNGMMVYTYRHGLSPVTHVEAPFEAALDPARFGLFPHAALLYRRDVRPAEQELVMLLDPVQAQSTKAIAEWDRPVALEGTPELRRTSVRFVPELPAKLETEPLKLLRRDHALVLPETALLPANATSVRSETGQLWRSWDIGYGTIDTPGTQAIYGSRGLLTEIRLTDVTFDVQTPFATVVASSLTGEPIATSDRLLVTAIGRAENTGMAYNIFRTAVVERGTGPMLLEPIVGKVTLRTSQTGLRVFALGPKGEVLRELPVSRDAGSLQFRLGDPALTMHYLVTR